MARKTGSHSEITGPRIRSAATELFARHGYAAVSMRQIAADVGVQAGAIYIYFDDKQSLLFELMSAHMDDLLAAWAMENPRTKDPIERLKAFTRFHIRYHLQKRDEVFISYMELRNLTPENFRLIEAKRRAYEAELESILRSGTESGAFSLHDIRVATMALIATLTGITYWYDEAGRMDVVEVTAVYWSMVSRMVTPEAEASLA